MPNNPRLPSGASFSDRNRSVSQQPRQPADTLPNPKLRQLDGTYLPAYTLQDESSERDGRRKYRN